MQLTQQNGSNPRARYPGDYEEYAQAGAWHQPLSPEEREQAWGEEAYFAAPHPMDTADMVALDAHILATPAIADIDADGLDELVVAVSYFFDKDYYEAPVRSDAFYTA